MISLKNLLLSLNNTTLYDRTILNYVHSQKYQVVPRHRQTPYF